jgi:hypothetical protein
MRMLCAKSLTCKSIYGNITRLREILVSIKKPSTLDDFKLFYEDLSFSSPAPNRIRRLRPVAAK